MNRFNPSLDRRQLLRSGGLALSMGAVVAACGADRGGSDAPGRLGLAEPAATLPPAEVNDTVLLRTAQSLEYTALAVYDAAAGTGVLTNAETALAGRFVDDHTGHAARLGTLITELGGEEFTCANPFIMERAVGPIVGALDGSDDVHRDVLNIAHAFESLAGASYQALVASLSGLDLRREAMRIGGDEHRHAAALAAAINADELVSPEIYGEPVGPDSDGFPVPYAIPSTFGRLTGIELVVGARDDEGTRFSTQLQTPAENSFVYEYQSC
ncbi:MAG: ferritin-like domain-containing protein [Ilumatobacter sp.]|uniref:ferritin-like domain-containing protein n=1 Tax=Ilumatobacter sp. TaxID=1967498 RepID=UPI0026304E26|nr:ferritin-like domain-containing protein [Ilumatobacter sp.]MDJ0767876.1 ferritin-like domain-containing protein [Ilumatobacter sp.]